MEIALDSLVKSCLKENGNICVFGEENETEKYIKLLVGVIGRAAIGRIIRNPEEPPDSSPFSIYFHLSGWDQNFEAVATKFLFGKDATISLFDDPTRSFQWNGYPVQSFILETKTFFVFPSINYELKSQVIQSCNGCVTKDFQSAEYGVIAGPVSNAEEWIGLRCISKELKGSTWIKKLESFLSGYTEFDEWRTFGKAKLMEGLACYFISPIMATDIVKKIIKHGATVKRSISKDILVIVPSETELDLKEFKLAKLNCCTIVQDSWIKSCFETVHIVSTSGFLYDKSVIKACLREVVIANETKLYIFDRNVLAKNEVEELKIIGFQITAQFSDADIIVCDCAVSNDFYDPRMVTKFCIIDYLAGHEQEECPYWHYPIPCSFMSSLSGTLWKIECENEEETTFWTNSLLKLGAKIVADDHLPDDYNTVGNGQTLEEKNYFSCTDLITKIKECQTFTKCLQELPCLSNIGENIIPPPTAPPLSSHEEMKKHCVTVKLQDFFRRKLHEFGILQAPIKLLISHESENISVDSVIPDLTGCFTFGAKTLLLGYQFAISMEVANCFTRAMCAHIKTAYKDIGLRGTVSVKKPTGEIAIIFNKKDKLFELFQVVPMGTTFQRDGVNFCGIQFRIENDVLDLLSEQVFHTNLAFPQVVVFTDRPNVVQVETLKTIVWHIKEQDDGWIMKKAVPIVVLQAEEKRFLIRRIVDGNAEFTSEIDDEILQHHLQISDAKLCQDSNELGCHLLKNWVVDDDVEQPNEQQSVVRASTRRAELEDEYKDFKKLLLEAFSLYHIRLAQRKKYDYSSQKFHKLLKSSLIECPFTSGSMNLSFDTSLQQYVVRIGSEIYYICKQGFCPLGMHRANELCFKHKKCF